MCRVVQLAVDRTADAAIAQFNQILFSLNDQLVINADLPEFVDQDSGSKALPVVQDPEPVDVVADRRRAVPRPALGQIRRRGPRTRALAGGILAAGAIVIGTAKVIKPARFGLIRCYPL